LVFSYRPHVTHEIAQQHVDRSEPIGFLLRADVPMIAFAGTLS